MSPSRSLLPLCVTLSALAGVLACSGSDTDASPSARAGSYAETETAPTAGDLLSDADARVLSGRLRAARRASNHGLRLSAYIALARLNDPEAGLLLRDGLRDAAPDIRRWAARGLGALGDAAPEQAERWLILALAAEEDAAVRAALLEGLGRIGSEASSSSWQVALAADDTEVRVAACRSVGEAGRRGRKLAGAGLASLLAAANSDAGPDLVSSCIEALGRLPSTNDQREAIGSALAHATSAASGEVRTLAYRGLGRRRQGAPALLARGASDTDWRAGTAAIGAMAPRAEVAFRDACGELITAAGRLDWRGERSALELHRLRATVAACARWAHQDSINALAVRALERVGAGEPSDLRGRAHCLLASFVDVGRGWPNESPRCGLGQVSDEVRAVQSAQVVARAPGADVQRWAFLSRLAVNHDVRVREAIVEASASVNVVGAKAYLLAALADSDRGVINTALTVLLERSEAWARGGEGGGLARIESAGLVGPMRSAYARLSELDDLEGLGLYVDVLGHLALSELDPTLDALAGHWNLSVRSKAVSLLRSLGRPLPDEAHSPVPNPQLVVIHGDDVLPRVRIHTERGDFVLEMRPDAAPVTSARFLELVDRRFYTGLSFHRVVPGFVVQGGDPRGDGYGGPDFSQRCEDNELLYERGAVGMALAGRDTGGSQFFITYGAEPSLDGRYTIFARVASGMQTVDRLQPGDRMLDVSRVSDPAADR